MKHPEHGLTILCETSVTLELERCKFFSNNFSYLGHVIHPRQLAVSRHKIDAIEMANLPTTCTELRSLLSSARSSDALYPTL